MGLLGGCPRGYARSRRRGARGDALRSPLRTGEGLGLGLLEDHDKIMIRIMNYTRLIIILYAQAKESVSQSLPTLSTEHRLTSSRPSPDEGGLVIT